MNLVWLLCFGILLSNANADVVFGTSIALSGIYSTGGHLPHGFQLAVYASNNRSVSERNGVLRDNMMGTLFLDDAQNSTIASQNIDTMFAMNESQLLGITSLPPMQATLFQTKINSGFVNPPPLVAPYSGDGKMRLPFSETYLNLRASFDTEFFSMVSFLTSTLRISRVAFIDGTGADSTAYNFSLAVQPFGLRIVSQYRMSDYISVSGPVMDQAVGNISAGNPQAIISMLFGAQGAAFIAACKVVLPPTTAYVMEPLVVGNIPTTLNATSNTDNVYSISAFPLITDNSSQIQNEFWRDHALWDPTWVPKGQQSLEGYIIGRWTIAILERMTGNVTRQKFLNTVFSNPIIPIGELFLGPMSSNCQETGFLACCNTAVRQMYIIKYPGGIAQYATPEPIVWDTCNPAASSFQVPTKVGQSLNFGNETFAAFRTGSALTSSFALLSYDDAGNKNRTIENLEELQTLDKVSVLISEDIDSALLSQVGVFGVAPVPNYNENFVSVSLSVKEELWAVLTWFSNEDGFYLLGDGGLKQNFSVALKQFGKTHGYSYVVVVDPFAQNVGYLTNFPFSKFVYIGCFVPEKVLTQTLSLGIPHSDIFFFSSIPSPMAQNTTLVKNFLSTGMTSFAEFWAYTNSRLVEKISSFLNGELTSSRILYALYSVGVLDIDGFSVGRYSSNCNSTELECCNKGSRQVFVNSGNWEELGIITIPFCNAKFGLESTSSTSSSSNDNILIGVLVGVLVPLFLVCCFVVLLLVVFIKTRKRRENWDIDFSELDVGDILGEGYSGKVCVGSWKDQKVAIKLLKAQNPSRKAILQFKEEMETMSNLRHPNIVLFMAACTKPPDLCIVMEFLALGSLFDLLHNELIPNIPQELATKLAIQAAKGMHFLHSSGIVHRDLKSLNLLLDSKWNVKVSDFGLSSVFKETREETGTVHWTAPEVLNDHHDIDFTKADVYSFGIILWEMMTREQPYFGMSPAAIAVAVIRDDGRPEIPEFPFFDGEYRELMTSCWDKSPDVRPSFLEIMAKISNLKAGSSSMTKTSTSDGSSTSSWVGPVIFKIPKSDEYVTLAFFDVIDGFKLWEINPDIAKVCFMLFNKTCRDIAEKYGGYECFVNGMGRGDGCMLFVFNSEKSCFCCLEETMSTIEDLVWPGGERLWCRASTVSGFVQAKRTKLPILYGEAIDKLLSYAENASPGQIIFDRMASNKNLKDFETTTGDKVFSIGALSTPPQQETRNLRSINTSRFVIDFSKVSMGKQIGIGSYGVVSAGKWKNLDVAVKRVVNQGIGEESLLEVRREASIMAGLEHPNIVVFIGACFEPPNICILTSLEKRGSLQHVLSSGDKLEWNTRKKILSGVCSGLSYLHQNNFVHRDIKSANVLIGEDWTAKICDFGFGRLREDNTTMTCCGTPVYTAPEVLRGEKYNEKCDIFSLGILIWETLTRKKPFEGMNVITITQATLDGKRPTIPLDVPRDLKKVIKKCWDEDAAKRPDILELCTAFSFESV